MASDREKLIQRLDELGKEWYAIDRETSPAEKNDKFQEIWLLAYKLLVPESFDGNKTVNAVDQDYLDEKMDKLLNLLEEVKRLFDPSKGSLYQYLSSRWNLRMKEYGVKKAKKTIRDVDISEITPTDDEGNEMDEDSALTIADNNYDPDKPSETHRKMEELDMLQFVLEVLLLKDSDTKIKDDQKYIFQLLSTAHLINIAKDPHIPRKGLQREREIMNHSNQRFLVFCYDSDRQIYVSINELEQTPLKTNRMVYQLAENRGVNFAITDKTADNPIKIPIQNKICITYLKCEEEKNITAGRFSQNLEKYRKHFDELLQSLRQN